MGRSRSPNRDKAFELFKASKGKISSKDIAEKLNESISNINSWRSKDKWSAAFKGGAPKGNKNAKGHGAPRGNHNAYEHGLYSKLMPKETLNIFNAIKEMSPLDMLWDSIRLKYAAILRAQKIMFVKSKKEMIKELKKDKKQYDKNENGEKEVVYTEEEFEFQFAWDRQATFINAQSKAMRELSNMIKQYDEMINKDWSLASEEQKLRIEKLKVDIKTKTIDNADTGKGSGVTINIDIPRRDKDAG
ncbi:MAG: phage terminase small subunit [Sarcina sp.]